MKERSFNIIFRESHPPMRNVTKDIFEYITKMSISECECDYELNELDNTVCVDSSRIDCFFQYITVELKKDVLFEKGINCVYVTGAYTRGEKIPKADELTLHDERKSEKLVKDFRKGYKYTYGCSLCILRSNMKLTVYDEMDNVLYEGRIDRNRIFTVVQKNKDKSLAFEYSYN